MDINVNVLLCVGGINLQDDAAINNDCNLIVGCVHEDEQPVPKKQHVDSLSNVDDSDNATDDGENLSFSAAFDDSDLLRRSDPNPNPRSAPIDRRFDGNTTDLPATSSEAQELCRTEQNCACTNPQHLPSASPPDLPKNVDHNPHYKSMNGICDVNSLNPQYQNAVVTLDGCLDGIADNMVNDVCDDVSLPSPETQVTDKIVNCGSIVHDCSCST